MDKLKLAEQSLVNDNIPAFKAGDTVNVHYRVREGEKERIQQFEGVVISRRGSGPNQTFICRKISAGNIGVERIFPLYSPFIAKIEPKKEGDVRRSKLYYLRDLRGKAARIKEKDRRDLQGAAQKAKTESEQKANPKTEEQEKGQTSTVESKPQKAEQEETKAKQPKKELGTSTEEEKTQPKIEDQKEKEKAATSEEE